MKEISYMETQMRIDWVDMAKGYGIIFAILAHLGVGIADIWIYTFHMPLFFFLSGCVFSTKYEFKSFVKRKCKSLIVPYFSLGFIMILFQLAINYREGVTIHSFIILFLKLFVQRRYMTLWYIACLFWLNIVFYIFVRKCKHINLIFLLVSGMFLTGLIYYHFGGIALPWNIDVILPASLFLFGGYWFQNNYERIRIYFTRKKSVICFFIFGIINICFGAIGVIISGRGLEMFESSYGFPPFTIMSAFAGIFCTIIFSHWFTIKFIRYIGQNSLIYYAWHQAIMIPLVRWGLKNTGITLDNISDNYVYLLAYRLFEFLIIILVLTLCQIIISNTRFKFMIGK